MTFCCNFFVGGGSVLEDREIMKCEEMLAMLNEYVEWNGESGHLQGL